MKSKKAELFKFPLIIKEAFDELQKAFYLTSILKHFNPVLSIQLETDVSDFVFTDILLQLFKNTGRNGIS